MSDIATNPTDTESDAVPGKRCAHCEHFSLSPVRVCPVCLHDDLHPATIPGDGVVYSATVVRSGPRDRNLPYGLAYVDLAAGVRVLAGYPAESPVLPGESVTVSAVGRTEADVPLLAVRDRATQPA